jgi:hypothetical protein
MVRRSIVGLLAFVSASPSFAHWQYTRWGMTLDEVHAAAPGRVVDRDVPGASTPDSRIRAGTSYSASGLSFIAAFGFNSAGGLNRVTLGLVETSRCTDLLQSLRSVYGAPDRGSVVSSAVAYGATWRDEQGGNLVNFLRIGDAAQPSSCEVTYKPILSRTESGL